MPLFWKYYFVSGCLMVLIGAIVGRKALVQFGIDPENKMFVNAMLILQFLFGFIMLPIATYQIVYGFFQSIKIYFLRIRNTLLGFILAHEPNEFTIMWLANNRFLCCLLTGHWNWKWNRTYFGIGWDYLEIGNFYESISIHLIIGKIYIYTPFRDIKEENI